MWHKLLIPFFKKGIAWNLTKENLPKQSVKVNVRFCSSQHCRWQMSKKKKRICAIICKDLVAIRLLGSQHNKKFVFCEHFIILSKYVWQWIRDLLQTIFWLYFEVCSLNQRYVYGQVSLFFKTTGFSGYKYLPFSSSQLGNSFLSFSQNAFLLSFYLQKLLFMTSPDIFRLS